MADLGEEKNVTGVFGGVELENNQENEVKEQAEGVFAGGEVEEKDSKELPTKIGFWAKFKAFWLQEIDWNKEIKVELTPYQQKVEDEINEFLHQEITFKGIANFFKKKN